MTVIVEISGFFLDSAGEFETGLEDILTSFLFLFSLFGGITC